MLGKKAKSVDCPAIDGIIDEAADVSGEVEDKNVLDAAIIAAGQAVEHYEITRYALSSPGPSALAAMTSPRYWSRRWMRRRRRTRS
jgi:hypothetical protein